MNIHVVSDKRKPMEYFSGNSRRTKQRQRTISSSSLDKVACESVVAKKSMKQLRGDRSLKKTKSFYWDPRVRRHAVCYNLPAPATSIVNKHLPGPNNEGLLLLQDEDDERSPRVTSASPAVLQLVCERCLTKLYQNVLL